MTLSLQRIELALTDDLLDSETAEGGLALLTADPLTGDFAGILEESARPEAAKRKAADEDEDEDDDDEDEDDDDDDLDEEEDREEY